jgi:hypothetical protein
VAANIGLIFTNNMDAKIIITVPKLRGCKTSGLTFINIMAATIIIIVPQLRGLIFTNIMAATIIVFIKYTVAKQVGLFPQIS